ncbi:DUF429 domain-containing protein [Ensifer sp. SSB1]|uniref:DUF429 domain-containing protein n=1 Tax=Ensifer sp. SSB1 TaxID=2795385 RepID=UPI001A497A25|nr:DUF429 domain-containing protein [Ensifer sp. SSB1]MBK5571390.1 DUF429 domain-containing protein [Ensifer sp. SSB1]
MRVVLGIDAAWTEREPSGVALITDDGTGWRLLEVAASYSEFLCDRTELSRILRHRGSMPDAGALISAGAAKAGAGIDLVAVDMPLATVPITGRRLSDNLISSEYGARHASTHTPSSARPGKISDELREGFGRMGFPLATTALGNRSLIEVYPHPALIELAVAERRLPYKISKIRKYWPDEKPDMRRQYLFEVWKGIVTLLDSRIRGVEALLPPPSIAAVGHEMKAYEDKLDAVVCAWVGACALDNRALAYGDQSSAIWVPIVPPL